VEKMPFKLNQKTPGNPTKETNAAGKGRPGEKVDKMKASKKSWHTLYKTLPEDQDNGRAGVTGGRERGAIGG